MVLEMEKPQVTEIKVRMDCNGCVQKIKKALQGVAGIHDIYVDFPEQKLTVTGWAEPEKLVKAIRKTRKSAVICVHTEESDAPGEGEAAPGESDAPPTETPPETPQTEAAPPPAEAPNEPSPPQPENQPPATRQPHQPTRPHDADGVHVVYHHPPDHGYQSPNGPWSGYHGGPGFRDERHMPPPPVYVQSYNTYRPSPHVTEHAYPRPPPPRYSYEMRETRASHYSGPGFRDEPPQQQPPPFRHSYETRPDHYSGPGLRDEPPHQHTPPPRYSYDTRPDHYGGPGLRDEPPQPPPPPPPPPPRHSYDTRPIHYTGPGFRDEPPQQPPQQPPQPVYATHSYNTYKPSPYVTGYAYPRSPPRYPTYTRPDSNSGPGMRGEGEPSQPSQPAPPPHPVYATHSHNIYRPSPYVSEYAYPDSPPRYSSYSIPDNYSGSHGNGNVTSIFSEENPNACRIV